MALTEHGSWRDHQLFLRLMEQETNPTPEQIAKLVWLVEHWHNNHDNQVWRASILRQRPDLPVDRIPAVRKLDKFIKEMETMTP
ncbi:TPA: hypothetical protein ACGQ50_000776 [Enterobacter cloacae]